MMRASRRPGKSGRWRRALRRGALIAGLVGAVLSGPAAAATFAQNKDRCFNAADPDLRIGACTALIQSGQVSDRALAIVFNGRALAFRKKGNEDRALADLNQAVGIDATYAGSYLRRGDIYESAGKLAQALADYDRYLFLKPDSAEGYFARAVCHEKMRRFDRAIADYGKAAELKPDSPSAHNGLAWLLATAPDAKDRNGAEAIAHANKAIVLKDLSNYRDTLAAAFAEAGDFAAAVREQEQAIARLKAEGKPQAIPDFESRLDLYRRGRPHRTK